MSSMTNPMDALTSLQAEIFNGIPLRRCKINSDLKMFVDQPNGRYRFTFVKVEANIIKAFSSFVFENSPNETPRLNIGYAVPPEYRKQGLATDIVEKSISEVKAEFKKTGIRSFYIEAVISVGNLASQKLVEKLFSSKPEEITDEVSGERAYFYQCIVQ